MTAENLLKGFLYLCIDIDIIFNVMYINNL